MCIITGSDRKSDELTCQFVRNHPAFGTAGIHPHNADSARKEDFVRIEQMLTTNSKLLAVGECGLDYDRMYSTKQNQSVVHCFTGDRATMETYLEMGFCIGITGWICDDRRADDLRKAVAILPPDRVMIETDAPYLTPRNVPGLGRTNLPQNVKYVARELAKYMHIDERELISHAKENTEKLFGIKEALE